MNCTIIAGESLETLKTFDANSVDSIVTDPPYEIGFNKREWDATGIAYNVAFWQECLRVLKPGGHLLSFGATRTWHRMATAVEDAGFEIRDSLAWIYGTGMPKTSDLSKAIDRLDASEERKRREFRFTAWLVSTGVKAKQIDVLTGTNMGNHYTTHPTQPSIPTPEIWAAIRQNLLSGVAIPEWVEQSIHDRAIESENTRKRKVTGSKLVPAAAFFKGEGFGGDASGMVNYNITTAHTEEAKQWEGFGTALKPAIEPIVLARKPLEKSTVARNVLAMGTGALNINGTRNDDGRYPTNVLLDEAQAVEVDKFNALASRVFYVAKPAKSEKIMLDGVAHPTVKPLALMRHLVRLATPPGGVVLDPFAGSGTTLEAAHLEGFESIGIEFTADYVPLIEARLKRAAQAVEG